MIEIKWADGNFKTEKRGFVQYDYGQQVKVYGLETDEHYLVFQFIKGGVEVDMQGTKTDDYFVVDVPNQFLTNAGDILMYCYFETENTGNTEKCAAIQVLSREKYPPEDPEEYHDILGQILEKLAEMQYEIDHWTITPEQLEQIVQRVESEIDLDDYYDKQETDEIFATKQEVNTQITGLGQALSNLSGALGLTNNRVSNLEVGKADKDTTYTKTEVDTLLANKADKSEIPDISGLATKQELTQGLAGKVDNATLNNYYTKTETYSKTEIDNILGDIETALEGI